jgi:CubicO group peptidase (beta-lactamase class C family)
VRRRSYDPLDSDLAPPVGDAARRALADSMTPGLAVALVCHGRIAWAAGYGVAGQAKGQLVTAATRFQAADRGLAVGGGRRELPGGAAEGPGRRWLYSGGGYSVLQLLVEELTGRPFADVMQPETGSLEWHRTAATAYPHDAEGGRIPEFCFAEQAAAGLVTTAAELARFVAAALPGPRGEPPGRGGLSPAGGAAGPHRRPRH